MFTKKRYKTKRTNLLLIKYRVTRYAELQFLICQKKTLYKEKLVEELI